MPFFNVDQDGTARRYSAEDERRITTARGRGDKSVRISDVQLKSGQILQFEVRFGKHAKSKKWKTPPDSGMVQVNLRNHNTRRVEYRAEGAAAPNGAQQRAAAAREPEPEPEPPRGGGLGIWECDRSGDGTDWEPYDQRTQESLTSAFRANPRGQHSFTRVNVLPPGQSRAHPDGGRKTFRYIVDFGSMSQTNAKTKKRRAVRRRAQPPWCPPLPQREAEQAPLRILCLDGGGSKGIVAATVLRQLEELCAPHALHELFDLVAGTSTGGILALGTCIARVPAEKMQNMYGERAEEIWGKRRSKASLLMSGAASHQYDAQSLERLLQEHSTDCYARAAAGTGGGEAAAPRQLRMDAVPDGTPNTFVVAGKEQAGVTAGAPFTPFLFRTYPAPAAGGRPKDGSSDCAVWQAGRATSAAPTYFAPVDINGTQYVDGGVLANNPCATAMEEAQDLWPGRRIGCVLSVGCGLSPKEYGDRAGIGAAMKKAADQLTSCQQPHLDVLQELRIDEQAPEAAGSAAKFRSTTYGGFA